MMSATNPIPSQAINFRDDFGNIESMEILHNLNDIKIQPKTESENKNESENKRADEISEVSFARVNEMGFDISPRTKIPKEVTDLSFDLPIDAKAETVRKDLSALNLLLRNNPHVVALVIEEDAVPSNINDCRKDSWYNLIPQVLLSGTSINHVILRNATPKQFWELQYTPSNPIDFINKLYEAGVRQLEFENGYLDLARTLPTVVRDAKEHFYQTSPACETTCSLGSFFCWIVCCPMMACINMCCCNANYCCMPPLDSLPYINPTRDNFSRIDLYTIDDIIRANFSKYFDDVTNSKYFDNVIKALSRFDSAIFSLFNSRGKLVVLNNNGMRLHRLVILDEDPDVFSGTLFINRATVWISFLKRMPSIIECNIMKFFDKVYINKDLNESEFNFVISLVNDLQLVIIENLKKNYKENILQLPIGFQMDDLCISNMIRTNEIINKSIDYLHWANWGGSFQDLMPLSTYRDEKLISLYNRERKYGNSIKALHNATIRMALEDIWTFPDDLIDRIIIPYLNFVEIRSNADRADTKVSAEALNISTEALTSSADGELLHTLAESERTSNEEERRRNENQKRDRDLERATDLTDTQFFVELSQLKASFDEQRNENVKGIVDGNGVPAISFMYNPDISGIGLTAESSASSSVLISSRSSH